MKQIALLFILFIGFSGYSQILYKKIQGSYENPIIGDITIDGYELTYRDYTYIYQTETDYSGLDNYVSYNYPGEEGTIKVKVTRNGTKYLVFGDGEYILIPKGKTDQKDTEAQRNAEAKRIAEEKAAYERKGKNLDALMGGFSDGDGKADGGEGDDTKAGEKGKETGDPNASGYYGIRGDGSGGNYRLGNRKAKAMPSPDYPCNEAGKVVVTITVNQSGSVISAVPGANGTTTSASCLLNEAKKAAMSSKFNADSNAPSKQVGEIIYNFSLSD